MRPPHLPIPRVCRRHEPPGIPAIRIGAERDPSDPGRAGGRDRGSLAGRGSGGLRPDPERATGTSRPIGPLTETMMSVVDASVFVDALVGIGSHGELARQELGGQPTLQVPAIFGAEVASALRGLVIRGELSSIRATAAL